MTLPEPIIRVVHTVTWDPVEVAGGQQKFANGKIVYFHGGGVRVLRDIIDSLQLKEYTMFGGYFEAFAFVANGTADIGSFLTTHEISLSERGLGTSVIFLQPLVREKSEVFFRQAPSENLRITALRPFTLSVWLTYLLFSVFIAEAMNILKRFENKCCRPINGFALFIQAITLCVGIGTCPITNAKNDAGSKPFSLVASVLRVIMLSLYTAKILSVLAAMDDLVKTPDDLIKFRYTLNSYSRVHIKRIFGVERPYNVVTTGNYGALDVVIGKGKRDPRQALLTHRDGFYPQAIYALNYSHEICWLSSFKSLASTLRVIQYIELGLNFRHQRIFAGK